MNPTAALCFILTGVSFFIWDLDESRKLKWSGTTLSLVVMIIALIRMIDLQHLANAPIDTVLFKRALNSDPVEAPIRMTFSSALGFFLTGCSFIFLNSMNSGLRKAVNYIASGVALIAIFSIIGYAYGIDENISPMAFHSAVCFLFVSLSINFYDATSGPFRVLVSSSAGAPIARLLLPAVFIAPIVLGYIRVYLHNARPISVEMGVTFLIASIILAFFLFTLYGANVIDVKDLQRKAAETKFEGIIESAPDALIMVRLGGAIELANEQCEKVFGYKREELMNQSIEILMPQSLEQSHRKHRDAFFNKPKARPMGIGMELIAKRKNGSEFPVEINLSPIQSETGTWVIATIRDTSERKKAEEKLQAANSELEAFSYSVSHDLRAPLRAINGFANILAEDYQNKLDEEGRKVIATITRNANRMGRLIDDMLNFSRVGKKEVNTAKVVDMNELVKKILGELPEPENKMTRFKIKELPAVNCDLDLITQVWTNYIINAVKFSSKKNEPLIEIGFDINGSDKIYFVRDNGSGFDNQYNHKLFGVFQRLHKQNEFEGTGVGLALVKRIIEKHGGRVWADGKPDQGATFYFSLPLHNPNYV